MYIYIKNVVYYCHPERVSSYKIDDITEDFITIQSQDVDVVNFRGFFSY